MKYYRNILTFLLGMGMVFNFSRAQEKIEADLAFLNGTIFTATEDRPFVTALAVHEGRILALGSRDEVDPHIGDSTRILNVDGKLVIPGFIDAHCHFSYGGHTLAMLDLGNARTVEELQKRLAERIQEIPEGQSVFGFASFPNTGLFKGLGWPGKDILDAVAPKNPVVIHRRGGHAVWVNSVSLTISGITGETEAPEGGEIVIDSATGKPSGILKESAAGLLKVRDVPRPKPDIERALQHAARMGLTGIQTGSNLEELEIYKQLREDGKLTLRVSAWVPVQSLDSFLQKGIRFGQGDDMVKVGMVKIFVDGTIGVRTALMFEPFSEEPGNTGLAQYKEQDFYALVEKAHAHGYQVGVHAIGDKGVHWVLNAIERAQQKHGKKGLRHRVEHNTVTALSDVERYAELGVVASMQPNITGGEMYRRQRLGIERAKRVDMWRTLLDHGAVLAWGTDWPVSPLNPMQNLYQLVTRYYPEQRLTMAEAIKYYTYGSAYSAHEEDIKGTLEAGKLADLVVLSQDLFTIAPREIMKTEVLYTILGGKKVYAKSETDKE